MNIAQRFTAVVAVGLVALPALASAQVYYYAPGATNGAYNYASYIPSTAMPYVGMGYQMQQQSQQQYQQYQPTYTAPSMSSSYYYPSQSQYQSQSQSQSQYQYSQPSYYNTSPSYNNSGYSSMPGYYTTQPQSVSYPSGTTGPFGTQLCYWSDYPTYAPCGTDPQQWIQDPYTGEWY